MSEERKKVLEMLAAGKITADEAERLLDKLASSAPGTSSASSSESSGGASSGGGGARPKYLRIVVDQPGRKQVNMRVPLSFLGSGAGLLGIMPQGVNERLAECGINFGAFSAWDSKEFGQAMRDLNVDVDKGDGKKVRIYCE
ncbi:MAG TPA: hypothetical protein VE077_03805 [Candidatus Methylomirabilis sp.]|nr:hypothetical protein [Candidatus Methylomirabilis sp.]